jgi:hypothetical protein
MQRYPIFDVASPLRDLIFYEVVDFNIQSNRNMEYGTPHHNPQNYPNHVLVYIAPNDKEGKTYRYYYAAKRENQDDYNWQINQGSELVRTYIIPRADYFARSKAERELVGEFTYPLIGTLDSKFNKYGFIEDNVGFADEILNSQFITIQRKYAEPVVYEIVWSKDYDSFIQIKKEYITAEVVSTPPTQVAGQKIEIKHGNTFHDIRITQTLLRESEADPEVEPALPYFYQKASIPDSIDFTLPKELEKIEYYYAWAWADSTGASPDYDEDYGFQFRIKYPRRGPHSATILRYVTTDPLYIQSLHPIDNIPNEISDSLIEHWAWFYASQENNIAKAKAGEIQLPATIHGLLVIDDGGVPDGVSGLDKFVTTEVPETPGYTEFVSKTELVIRHQVIEMDMQMFEVQITILNMDGIYDDPFMITSQPTPSTTIDLGDPAVTLAVTVNVPSGSVYQWYEGVSGDKSSPILGATSSTYAISPSATQSYWVRIQNALGTLYSNTATITVIP